MYQFSDSESSDSEDGIRFKTDSTRNKIKNKTHKGHGSFGSKSDSRLKERHSTSNARSQSPRYRRDDYRKTSDVRRSGGSSYSKSRSRSPKHKSKKLKKHKKEISKNSHDADHLTVKSTMPINVDNVDVPAHKRYEDKIYISKSETNSKNSKPAASLQEEKNKVSEDNSFGPVLPPYLINKETEVSEEGDIKLTPIESFGPVLPVHMVNKPSAKSSEAPLLVSGATEKDCDSPTLASKNDENEIGPALPSPSSNSHKTEILKGNSKICNIIGPDLPQHLRDSLAKVANDPVEMEDDIYGPLPSGTMTSSKAHIALEERALQMKIDNLIPKDDKVGREEWMIELPQVHASNLGLGPRQFRANPAPDLSDRSSWTDTPEDKAKKSIGKAETKVDLRKEAESNEVERRNKEQEEIIKKHKKKKKDKSLLQIHQDGLKKKKEDEGPSVRRPFSRDIDLKVNCFDEAQKKAILKKAQLLDDRFSRGQAKFL